MNAVLMRTDLGILDGEEQFANEGIGEAIGDRPFYAPLYAYL